MACLPVASDGALGEAACYAPTAHTPQALTVDPAGAFVYAGGGPRRTGGAHPAPDWAPPEPTGRDSKVSIFRVEGHGLLRVGEVGLEDGPGVGGVSWLLAVGLGAGSARL